MEPSKERVKVLAEKAKAARQAAKEARIKAIAHITTLFLKGKIDDIQWRVAIKEAIKKIDAAAMKKIGVSLGDISKNRSERKGGPYGA